MKFSSFDRSEIKVYLSFLPITAVSHLTAERISPEMNAFFSDSCLFMTSIGIILSIPFVRQIFRFILLMYGIQMNKNAESITTMYTQNTMISVYDLSERKSIVLLTSSAFN